MALRPKPYTISDLTGEAAANIDEMFSILFDDLSNVGGIASITRGGIAYGTGTALAVSAAGTTGQALLSGGTGAPTWGTVANTSVSMARIMTRAVLGI